nr:MAG TPA_asm: hypothetical protein [Caudoviricetes sp.]
MRYGRRYRPYLSREAAFSPGQSAESERQIQRRMPPGAFLLFPLFLPLLFLYSPLLFFFKSPAALRWRVRSRNGKNEVEKNNCRWAAGN